MPFNVGKTLGKRDHDDGPGDSEGNPSAPGMSEEERAAKRAKVSDTLRATIHIHMPGPTQRYETLQYTFSYAMNTRNLHAKIDELVLRRLAEARKGSFWASPGQDLKLFKEGCLVEVHFQDVTPLIVPSCGLGHYSAMVSLWRLEAEPHLWLDIFEAALKKRTVNGTQPALTPGGTEEDEEEQEERRRKRSRSRMSRSV